MVYLPKKSCSQDNNDAWRSYPEYNYYNNNIRRRNVRVTDWPMINNTNNPLIEHFIEYLYLYKVIIFMINQTNMCWFWVAIGSAACSISMPSSLKKNKFCDSLRDSQEVNLYFGLNIIVFIFIECFKVRNKKIIFSVEGRQSPESLRTISNFLLVNPRNLIWWITTSKNSPARVIRLCNTKIDRSRIVCVCV